VNHDFLHDASFANWRLLAGSVLSCKWCKDVLRQLNVSSQVISSLLSLLAPCIEESPWTVMYDLRSRKNMIDFFIDWLSVLKSCEYVAV
jgi:hypothetical protein